MSELAVENMSLSSADTDNWRLIPPKVSQALAALAADPEWELRAACKGVDAGLFFPYGDTAESRDVVPEADIDVAERAAMKNVVPICGSCAVRFACIGSAIKERSVGIRGGTTTLVRKGMLRSVRPILRMQGLL